MMKTILQIFTGNYQTPNYTAEQIIERLETILSLIHVEKVIIGWYADATLYQTVGEYLHSRSIDMVLWLPVFSETAEFVPMQEAKDVWGKVVKTPRLQEGETFAFSCPTHSANMQAVQHVYETQFAAVPFDGVFLDRIRTHSFVGGVSGVLSCGCDSCKAAYALHGVSTDEVARMYTAYGDHFFDAEGYTATEGFLFQNPVAKRFFKAKGQIIANRVTQLAAYFKCRGLQVGLDLYAPLMSGFVGQHYLSLAACADFIKPMLYRATNAPAGIGYEYALLRKTAPLAIGYPTIETDISLLNDQLSGLSALPCKVYAGIEVNYREDIAPTDAAYITQSLSAVHKSGIDGVVLSWDVMLAPDEHIQATFQEGEG